MGKLSLLVNFLAAVGRLVLLLGRLALKGYWRVWAFLKLRLPFIQAVTERHIHNPATVFVDAAIVLLTIYFGVGVYGYGAIYLKKSEARMTEIVSLVYPLPAARVNNSFIWANQFLARLRYLNTFNTQAPADIAVKPPTDAELRARIVEGLIEDRIIFLEAKERKLKVTSGELNAAFVKQGGEKEIKEKIAKLYGMTIPEFKTIIAEQVLKEKIKNSVLTRIRVRHILTSNLPAAQEARKQLDEGKNFVDLAKEFSQDAQSVNNGGDLGYWYKGELASQISPGFEDEVFKLQVNQVAGPVQTKFGFHLIQATERTGDNLQTYEEWLKERTKSYKIKRYIPL